MVVYEKIYFLLGKKQNLLNFMQGVFASDVLQVLLAFIKKNQLHAINWKKP